MNITEAATTEPVITVTTGIITAAVGGVLVAMYKRRRKSIDQAKDWYGEAIGLIGQLQQAGQQTTMFKKETDRQMLKNKLEPLAADLQSHAGNAPERVEEQARAELIYLSTFASGIVSLSDTSADMKMSDLFEEAQNQLQKDAAEKYDIEEINEIFEPSDLAPPEEEIDESDINEKALKEFIETLSEESVETGQIATVEDVLEMSGEKLFEAIDDEEFWNQFLDGLIQKYIQVYLIQVSGEVYSAMEQRKQSM